MKKCFIALLAACLLLLYAPVNLYAADIGITQTSGTYPLTNGNSYVINGPVNASAFTIKLDSGSAALTINGTVSIDDTNAAMSPISVAAGATLTLMVNGTFTIKGGAAGNGQNATTGSAAGGAGGFAAIAVPAGATLRLGGAGNLNTYGGRAGNAGSATSTAVDDRGSGGGGGAGAGIGGNGGQGGIANDTRTTESGQPGQNAGSIMITDRLTVTAIGGGGGSGGDSRYSPGSSGGGGGGGYPAAGIGGGGGGGGGGNHSPAGGGFSGGAAQGWSAGATGGVNGACGGIDPMGHWAAGGGYFQISRAGSHAASGLLGGGGGGGASATIAGNGGSGGAGGNVSVTSTAVVYAYNGNQYTDGTADHEMTTANAPTLQTPIYAQLGYALNSIRSAGVTSITGRTADAVAAQLNVVPKTVQTTLYGLGVGAGAGYTEGGNGTYFDESTKPGMPQVSSSSDGGLLVYGWTKPSYNGTVSITGYKVNVYQDADCTVLVKTVTTDHLADVGSPVEVTGLSEGQIYYVTVSALFGTAAGVASAAGQGTVFGVSIAPEAGTYYKSVNVKLTSSGVTENGYTLVYSTDGINWTTYPSSGITLTKAATIHYGIRGGGKVQKLGERTYDISKQPITIGSITIHKYTGGTAREDITGQSTAGLDGQQVCAVVTNPMSYIGGGGCIVIAAYDAANRMKTVSITPLFSGAQTADVTSKPITLPGDMASHDIRAFVVTGFADMAPVSKLAKVG